jgi:type IV secretory pathway TrbL component
MVDRLNLFANEAHQALINSEQAITFAQATINGDFTLFLRGNVANNWTVGQNFPVGTQIAGSAIATQSYVTSALGSYATSANLSAAVTTAATDATTKATAAQTAAAADATNKVNIETNRAKSMEGFLLCIALR